MHPIQLEVDYVERQSRLTTFFRYFLVLPHAIVAGLWGIPVYVVSFIAWFAILFTGRFPLGMWEFAARWLRYSGRVNGFGALLADGFPPFDGDAPYPIRVTTERQERLSRLTTFFRGIMMIPVVVILYFWGLVAEVVLVIAWFAILITGRMPAGMHGFLVTYERFRVRATAYALFLTDRFPSGSP